MLILVAFTVLRRLSLRKLLRRLYLLSKLRIRCRWRIVSSRVFAICRLSRRKMLRILLLLRVGRLFLAWKLKLNGIILIFRILVWITWFVRRRIFLMLRVTKLRMLLALLVLIRRRACRFFLTRLAFLRFAVRCRILCFLVARLVLTSRMLFTSWRLISVKFLLLISIRSRLIRRVRRISLLLLRLVSKLRCVRV